MKFEGGKLIAGDRQVAAQTGVNDLPDVLKTLTPSQAETYISNQIAQIIDLDSAKEKLDTFLPLMGKTLVYLLKRTQMRK